MVVIQLPILVMIQLLIRVMILIRDDTTTDTGDDTTTDTGGDTTTDTGGDTTTDTGDDTTTDTGGDTTTDTGDDTTTDTGDDTTTDTGGDTTTDTGGDTTTDTGGDTTTDTGGDTTTDTGGDTTTDTGGDTTTDTGSTAPSAVTMALPDEIVVDQDNPNAGDYIYVSGRCYEKTETSGEEYEVTHDMVFGGMLDKKTVTISSPKDEPLELTSDRIDIMRVPFVGCGDCSSYGERYRGQIKETGKDFKIKVIKEIDTDKGNVFRYKLNGEDRNGFFNLETNRAILIYDNDSLTFDIESLHDEKAKFQVDNPTEIKPRGSDGNKLMIGKTRADAGRASIARNKSSSISVGTFKYTESGDADMGGNLKIESNPYEANPQYNTEKN